MKKTFIALQFCALIALASCNKNDPTSEKKETSSSSTNSGSIVYVNTDSLITNYQYAKDIQKELEGKGIEADNDLTSKGRALQNEIIYFQNHRNELSMVQAQQQEQTLGKKQQEFQTFEASLKQKLQGEAISKNKDMYDKVTTYLKKFSKEKNFKFVLGVQGGQDKVLYADPTLDITTEVVKALNSEYETSKKSSTSDKKADDTKK